MTDREKVINGLECCASGNMCKEKCPYDELGYVWTECVHPLAADALSLLKAQDDVIDALLKVGYPHNFQREPLWIVNYMYAITDVIKKAVKISNEVSTIPEGKV